MSADKLTIVGGDVWVMLTRLKLEAQKRNIDVNV